ncbi:MAG: type II toxin-antitoxin system VapC family toxin [Bryobacteraceae bacterium]
MEERKVLDSWALLAWLLDQPAASQVEALLERAETGQLQLSMSWMNIGEVFYMTSRKLGAQQAEEFHSRLPSLPIRLVLPDAAEVMQAAKLKARYRISYADAFAVSLAIREDAALVTGDPELRALGEMVAVDWIGP